MDNLKFIEEFSFAIFTSLFFFLFLFSSIARFVISKEFFFFNSFNIQQHDTVLIQSFVLHTIQSHLFHSIEMFVRFRKGMKSGWKIFI